MDLSVIIVNYNVKDFLNQAIRTLIDAGEGLMMEIFVVDNGSTDGSPEMVREQFPEVKLISLENVGFARGNNHALPLCHGRYILLINADTVVHRETLRRMVEFMDSHPDAGASGCKILNSDGSLQLACRRGFPTPAVAFYKIVGLSNLFPKSTRFGRYNLTHLDPDQIHEVDAISGSFMMIRQKILEDVGLLDEEWFMYGEDLDWCYRIKQKGWKIFYVPTTEIIHFKGESAKHVSKVRDRITFYKAMYIFVRKHFRRSVLFFPMEWLLTIGIILRGCASLVIKLFERFFLQIVDSSFIVLSLSLGLMIRYRGGASPPPYSLLEWVMIYTVCWGMWISIFTLSGLYGRWRYSFLRAVGGTLIGFAGIILLVFFFKGYNFSRAVALYTLIFNVLFIGGWRLGASILMRPGKGRGAEKRRVVIIGAGKEGEAFLSALKDHPYLGYEIVGFVDSQSELRGVTIEGKMVIGLIDDLPEVVRRYKVDEIVVTVSALPYSQVLNLRQILGSDRVLVKLVPGSFQTLVNGKIIETPEDLPLVDVTYRQTGILSRLFGITAQ